MNRAHSNAPPEPAPPTAPGRILALDDDSRVRKFVTKLLLTYGHHVDAVESVDLALDRLTHEHYDVALVDLHLPESSGLDLLDAIRSGPIPVVPILLTGTTDVAAAVASMKRGAFDYVGKPIAPDALIWAVDRALQVARGRLRESALERVASEWAATFDACPDVLLILSADGAVLRANEAAGRAAGTAPESLAGRSVAALFPGGLGASIGDRLRQRPGGPPASVFDTVLGSHFLVTADPIRTGPGTWVVVVRDVAPLVRGEEERKHLLRRVLSAQEDERRRIARELHDGIGQALVSLSVGLAALQAAPHAAEGPERVARLARVAVESLDEIRRLAHGLRPAILDDMGLVAALERLTEVFTRVHGVRADLLVAGEWSRLPTEIESALYRIVQEALTNVAKYAQARTVDVALEVSDGAVHVSVTDDGTGLPIGARDAAGGTGLSGMRERAGLLGGTFRIDFHAGRGTSLDVKIPLP